MNSSARPIDALAFRLKPGSDLLSELKEVVASNHIKAGFILTAVGSLTSSQLRLAGMKNATRFEGNREILALSGTLAQSGLHLHITLADADGKTIGGHVMDGCIVHTTAEIIIGSVGNLEFRRELDDETGYYELTVAESTAPDDA